MKPISDKWTTKDGTMIPVATMTEQHVHNCIAMAKRKLDRLHQSFGCGRKFYDFDDGYMDESGYCHYCERYEATVKKFELYSPHFIWK